MAESVPSHVVQVALELHFSGIAPTKFVGVDYKPSDQLQTSFTRYDIPQGPELLPVGDLEGGVPPFQAEQNQNFIEHGFSVVGGDEGTRRS